MESNATLGSQTPEELEERQAALDRGEPFLLFRDGDGRQRIVSLGEAGESVTIGRRYEARYAWTAARSYADAADTRRIAAKIAGGPAAAR